MPIAPIPPATARVARAAFPQGNRYLRVADALETRFTDDAFLARFPTPGPPAHPPWRLALVTILPCAAGRSDRPAAHAVRGRIDWQDVRRLELTDAGFEASVLSACRPRLITGAAASLLLDPLRTWCRDRQLVKARGRQRTDSTPLLAAGRALNRLEVVGDTLRHALQTLAVVAPAWLRTVRDPDGQERYARRAEEDRLPTTQAARAALTLTLGPDGWRSLAAVDHPDAAPGRREVPAMAILRRVWRPKYGWDGTPLRWREAANLPPAARFLSSPDDPEAHDARQHTTPWGGDTGHRTDTCEDDLPHLSTPIDTTPGPTGDGAAPPQIHAALQQRGLLPGTPSVDTGFLDADLLVKRRDDDGVDLLGPTRLDEHWHAREGAGFDVQPCQIEGDQPQARCPAGKTRISWTPAVDHRGHAVITVKCSSTDGRRGDHVSQCLRAKQRDPRRTRTLRPQPPDQALQGARPRAATEAFHGADARRAGIEGTLSRGTRSPR
jgi:transposase